MWGGSDVRAAGEERFATVDDKAGAIAGRPRVMGRCGVDVPSMAAGVAAAAAPPTLSPGARVSTVGRAGVSSASALWTPAAAAAAAVVDR